MGVMLLMFGVGLHFSLERPARGAPHRGARRGACRSRVATAMGMGAALCWGWTLGGGLVFGLALSVASTVVLLRALEARGAARHRQRPHRGRLADRRGPGDGAGAGAAAAAGRGCSAAQAPAAAADSACAAARR
ncbi:MAG: hypothetical protein MZW92_50420 [Comamonadaceae bacterium]|nr:hypothetical protein [Comamonadaceae bacterium]